MHVLPWFQSGQWSTFDWNKVLKLMECTFTYCFAEPKRQYMFTCKVSRYCFLAMHDSIHILSWDKCWSNAGPTLNQHRLSVSCLLVNQSYQWQPVSGVHPPWILGSHSAQTCSVRSTNTVEMLAQRWRLWRKIETQLGQRIWLAEDVHLPNIHCFRANHS